MHLVLVCLLSCDFVCLSCLFIVICFVLLAWVLRWSWAFIGLSVVWYLNGLLGGFNTVVRCEVTDLSVLGVIEHTYSWGCYVELDLILGWVVTYCCLV